MIIQDDRTEEQKQTLKWAVVGTDGFMSGWGLAENGASYAAWATDEGHLKPLQATVEQRGDMKRVRIVYLPEYRPRGQGHCHIYVNSQYSHRG